MSCHNFSCFEFIKIWIDLYLTPIVFSSKSQPYSTVIGNAGQSLTPISLPMAPWTTYNASEWGWSHVAVSNASHLRMDFYADVPIGEKPPVHYSFEINRNR